MKFRIALAGGALAACILAPTASNASAIYSSLTAWAAAVGGGYDTTSSTGVGVGNFVTAPIILKDGQSFSVAGADDQVLQPLNGWGPWSGGYTGDVIDTSSNTETLTFKKGSSGGINGLALDLSPDFGLFSSSDAETFTVTLSDGTTTTISGTYPAGTTQFVGFTGSNITSITITTTNAGDFAFGNIRDVPEPMSTALLVTGLLGLGAVRRRPRG